MGMFNKVTKKISGVEQSRNASPESEVRELLKNHGFCEENIEIAERYFQCADCEYLKEEFKLLGVTIKDMEPACGECGCNLSLKIPLDISSCPLGKW